jgi:hypothetical protein
MMGPGNHLVSGAGRIPRVFGVVGVLRSHGIPERIGDHISRISLRVSRSTDFRPDRDRQR